jgi:hypothetical protein
MKVKSSTLKRRAFAPSLIHIEAQEPS